MCLLGTFIQIVMKFGERIFVQATIYFKFNADPFRQFNIKINVGIDLEWTTPQVITVIAWKIHYKIFHCCQSVHVASTESYWVYSLFILVLVRREMVLNLKSSHVHWFLNMQKYLCSVFFSSLIQTNIQRVNIRVERSIWIQKRQGISYQKLGI